MLRFSWDEKKNTSNRRKHGVSFEEAQTAFFDDNAIEFCDPDHGQKEDRFILIGRSLWLRILVVCHCYRQSEDVIRIISARKATLKERTYYAGRKGRP